MSLFRGSDDSERLLADVMARAAAARFEERPSAQRGRVASGTLACARCDAPVALAAAAMSLLDPLGCPFCGHGGVVRDFLSLASPSRPARVHVRIAEAALPRPRARR